MLSGALVVAAGALAAPQVRWNPKAPENEQVLPAFSYASVEPVLTAVGARYQRRAGRPDRPQLLVEFANRRRATLVFSGCDGQGACKGLSIQSYWTPIAGASERRSAAVIAGFNQRYAFTKAFIAADGRPALHRYLTADYGFIRGNLAVNFVNFANQAETFATEVLRPLAAGAR